jgi:hypothetical protein
MDPNQQNIQRPYQMPQIPIKRSRKSMIISGGIIAFLVVIIGFLTFLLIAKNNTQKSSNKTSTAAANNPLLATVGSQKIYKSTVEKAASEEYDPNHLSNKVIKQYLEVVIERAILGIEADKQGITVTDADIADYKKQYPTIRNQNIIRFNIIKQKLIAKDVNYVDAFTIGYSIPPLNADYVQTPENVQRRSLENSVGDEIVQKLEAQETPYDVTQQIYDQYPILQPVIGINGYIFENATDKALLQEPRRFIYNPEFAEQPLYQALFSQSPGEIKKYVWQDGSGMSVIQTITVHKSSTDSYKDWINTKKKELVVYNQDELKKL